MQSTFFKIIGQKTAGKLILIAVVSEDFIDKIPTIFECQGILMPRTIYSGTYPDIRINTDTIKDITSDKIGMGIAGIITESEWYCQTNKEQDIFGIALEE